MSEYAKGDITWWSHMHTPEHIHTYTDRYSCDEKQTNERKDHREAYLRTTTYMGCNHAHYVRRRIAPFLSQPSTHACMHRSIRCSARQSSTCARPDRVIFARTHSAYIFCALYTRPSRTRASTDHVVLRGVLDDARHHR